MINGFRPTGLIGTNLQATRANLKSAAEESGASFQETKLGPFASPGTVGTYWAQSAALRDLRSRAEALQGSPSTTVAVESPKDKIEASFGPAGELKHASLHSDGEVRTLDLDQNQTVFCLTSKGNSYGLMADDQYNGFLFRAEK